ncbi:redox-regulated ATPase YchF [uncultured Clostridium sp.]|uniref:redox-regulated ATPase YchF n=1 Tax=uncultured Clostridium sp. TaxID=59620 RepID=UPI002613119A|nr:redox-regulated ATPase YchF [uncultured Clostridium sp.]
MKLGIVGLPNVGKSTLFNAITKAGAEAANYPFCTIEPNIGVVSVPDKRMDVLEEMYGTKKKIYTAIEFYDIAGLVKGASKGEGLGNKFLSHIREVESIVHVVRCFEDENVVHVDGSVDPIRDIETISLELIFADIDVIEKRMERALKGVRSGDAAIKAEYALMERLKAHLEASKPARTLEVTEDEEAIMKGLFLITSKPVLYACNISEDDMMEGNLENDMVLKVKAFAEGEEAGTTIVSAKLEEELSGLDDDEKAEMLSEYGLEESGLDKLIQASYKLLGLISYLTAGVKEVRAWTIKEGTKAPAAASKIHSDIERGFIRAEVVGYEDLVACGSEPAAKEKGLYRLEGKEYVMKDGDVVQFRFNV